MKKKTNIILVLLGLLFLSSTNEGPANTPGSNRTGMSVWNNSLYIHTSDTLVTHGNLYLFHAQLASP